MGRLHDVIGKAVVRGEVAPRVDAVVDHLPLRPHTKVVAKYVVGRQAEKLVTQGYKEAKVSLGFTGSGRCQRGHRMNSRDRHCQRCGEPAVPATIRLCPNGHRAAEKRKVKFCRKCGMALADRSAGGAAPHSSPLAED